MAGDQGRGISQSTREPRGRRDKQGAAMSMAEASSSSNELLADNAERVPAGLRIQALDFSHCSHFQSILLELYDREAPGPVEVKLVGEERLRNKCLGWPLLRAALEWL